LAEPLYKRSLAILEKAHGADDAHVAAVQHLVADMYRNMGRVKEADVLEEKATRFFATHRVKPSAP
jgi:hypothetical protein